MLKCWVSSFLPKVKFYSTKPAHPLKKILNKKEVISFLANNILYKDDFIVVFNKPAGMGKSKPSTLTDHAVTFAPLYLESILHDLVQLTPDFKELHLAKFPDRYSSGVMIFASSAEAMEKINQCKRRIQSSVDYHERYLGITAGRPVHKELEMKFGIRLAESKCGTRVAPILEDKWSNSDWKRQKVKIIRCKHSVLDSNKLSSLTRLSISTTAKNAVRLYFAIKLLSPLLGDNLFSGRVKNVMGVPMLVDPWSDAARTPKKLPPQLLKQLNLTQNDSNIVPLCLHLEEFRLPRYFKDGDLVLRAPPPPTFDWVCEQLNLSLPNEANREITSSQHLLESVSVN